MSINSKIKRYIQVFLETTKEQLKQARDERSFFYILANGIREIEQDPKFDEIKKNLSLSSSQKPPLNYAKIPADESFSLLFMKQNRKITEETSSPEGAYKLLTFITLFVIEGQVALEKMRLKQLELKSKFLQSYSDTLDFNLVSLAGEVKKILDGVSEEKRFAPKIRRADFFEYFLTFSQYALVLVENLSEKPKKGLSPYNKEKTTLSVPGLLNINKNDYWIQYIGINKESDFKYNKRLQDYVLLSTLARFQTHTTRFGSMMKILSDPKECDRPHSSKSMSSYYNLLRSIINTAQKRFNISGKELWINPKTETVGLTPQQ